MPQAPVTGIAHTPGGTDSHDRRLEASTTEPALSPPAKTRWPRLRCRWGQCCASAVSRACPGRVEPAQSKAVPGHVVTKGTAILAPPSAAGRSYTIARSRERESESKRHGSKRRNLWDICRRRKALAEKRKELAAAGSPGAGGRAGSSSGQAGSTRASCRRRSTFCWVRCGAGSPQSKSRAVGGQA